MSSEPEKSQKTRSEAGLDSDTTAEFEKLVDENSDFVYNVAYRMMNNPQEAEDVAQDAFLSAYRAWDR